eukprot:gene15967-7299_t
MSEKLVPVRVQDRVPTCEENHFEKDTDSDMDNTDEMVRNYQRKKDRAKTPKENIEAAVHAIKDGMSIRKAGQLNDVNYRTLSSYIKLIGEKESLSDVHFGYKQPKGPSCAVNAIGNHIPPFFVFPRVNIQDHWLLTAPIESSATTSGWMNEDTFVKYMKHFVKATGISPFDRNVFPPEKFLSTYSTDRPMVEATQKKMTPSDINDRPTRSTSRESDISLQSTPYPNRNVDIVSTSAEEVCPFGRRKPEKMDP